MTITQYTAEVDAVTARTPLPAVSEEFLQLVATYKSKLMGLATTCYSNAIAAREFHAGPRYHEMGYVFFAEKPAYTLGINLSEARVALRQFTSMDAINLALDGASLEIPHHLNGYVTFHDDLEQVVQASKHLFLGPDGNSLLRDAKVDAIKVTSRLTFYDDDFMFFCGASVQPYSLISEIVGNGENENSSWERSYRCHSRNPASIVMDGTCRDSRVKVEFRDADKIEKRISDLVRYDLSPLGCVAPVGLLALHHLKKVGNLFAAEATAAKRRGEMVTGLIDEL